jgi:hypothetical protein
MGLIIGLSFKFVSKKASIAACTGADQEDIFLVARKRAAASYNQKFAHKHKDGGIGISFQTGFCGYA